MARYKNPAIKGIDENGEPIGDPFEIMYHEQQQILEKDVYPSKKELREIDRKVKKGGDKTVGEILAPDPKDGKEKKKYTQSEKFRYRAEKCKKGSTYKTEQGEVKPYSEFKRGEMCGRNKEAVRNLAVQKKKGII